jgi:hypothetical protein
MLMRCLYEISIESKKDRKSLRNKETMMVMKGSGMPGTLDQGTEISEGRTKLICACVVGMCRSPADGTDRGQCIVPSHKSLAVDIF